MAQWAPIEVADALELLSPDFKSEAVRSHAVAALTAKDDDELLLYLLQLVQVRRSNARHRAACTAAFDTLRCMPSAPCQPAQHSTAQHGAAHRPCCSAQAVLPRVTQALRFEAADNSRLARFLVTRAAANPAFATFLHW